MDATPTLLADGLRRDSRGRCAPSSDPVCASDGNSYEREAIMRIIRSAPAQRKSPITREPLQTCVFPNAALRKRIQEHESEMLDVVEGYRKALSNLEPAAKRPCP